jgi:uncharacterized protein (DUF2062 family)
MKHIKKQIMKFVNFLLEKLFKINDTPQKVAIGLGLGVFTGILPGVGPAAAFFLAVLFRVNRGGALLSSLFTNTWVSFIAFMLSIKIGSALTGSNWMEIRDSFLALIKDFHWANFFGVSFFKIILPIAVGYLVIAFTLGLITYLVALIVITKLKPKI